MKANDPKIITLFVCRESDVTTDLTPEEISKADVIILEYPQKTVVYKNRWGSTGQVIIMA